MRSQYTAALAGRTLGALPVLRPARPSRFEPETPAGGAIELDESLERTTTSGQARAEPAAPSLSDRGAAPDDDAPLLALHDPPEEQVRAVTRRARNPAGPGAEPLTSPPEPIEDLAAEIAGQQLSVVAPEVRRAVPAAVPPPEPQAVAGEGAAAAEPAIVVRIGRVEVRAVHEPVSAPAVPRRPPPEGPTLAEHLVARDRGRR